jgi:acetyl esterase/lipase
MKISEARFVQDHKISSLPETRKRWHALWVEDARKALQASEDEVEQQEISIPVRDGYEVRALIFRPRKVKDPSEALPLAIIMHGGGFVIGIAEMEAAVCIEATKRLDCITISLEYRLSPEVKFPVAYDDCWDAINWVSQFFCI